MTLQDVDIYDPDVYVRGVPHAAFRFLRREAPVYWHPEPGGPGFWAITKYDDLVRISLDSATFSSARGTNIPDLPEDALRIIQMMMVNMDPPKHTQYRRTVSKGFTPKVVRELEPRIRSVATGIIDRVAARGRCDFVTDIAAELPLQVIIELMGVPQEDRHQVLEWTNQMIGAEDSEYAQMPAEGKLAAMQVFNYAHHIAAEREREPQDDIVTTLVNAEPGGERLTRPEFAAFFMLIAVAGNETTRNLISGAMRALIEHPEQRAKLQADPALIPVAVEEMLRWVTPVMHFRRTAARDAEIRGQKIREGEKVVIYYSSANRDEDVFPDGDVFDTARSPNDHVTFGGGGAHFCLGSNLAKLEIRVMFEELLRRLPDIELAAPVQRLRSNFINGIKHMPVQFTPERG
ncbi:MAG TPA: cytochrome P450 [Dehalococcoidia bacterium]|nr:cytochrome P450 [Dehalococcoidia bacterium]